MHAGQTLFAARLQFVPGASCQNVEGSMLWDHNHHNPFSQPPYNAWQVGPTPFHNPLTTHAGQTLHNPLTTHGGVGLKPETCNENAHFFEK